MKLLIILLAILPLVSLSQKIHSRINCKDNFGLEEKLKGKVKFVRTQGNILAYNHDLIKDPKGIDEWESIFSNLAEYRYINDSIIYTLNGDIKERINIDTPYNLEWIRSYKYDSLNNLIEWVDSNVLEANKYHSEIFKYDRHKNLISNIRIRGNGTKEDSLITKYEDNHSTRYDYLIDSVGNYNLITITKIDYEKDKIKGAGYDGKGNLRGESLFSQKGKTHSYIGKSYLNGQIREYYYTTGRIGANKKAKYITTTYLDSSMRKYTFKYDHKGNKTIENLERYDKNKTLLWTISKSYKYTYDSKGNYISKTIYREGVPIIEVDRVIGYYH